MANISEKLESTSEDTREATVEVRALSGATSLQSSEQRDDYNSLISSTGNEVDRERSRRDAELRKIYRKIDWRLLSWYGLVFVLVKLSTKNITNAAIMNLEEGDGIKHQLGNLTSSQWAWVLSAFAYPYIIFEPVSTLLLKHFSPRRWMSRILFTWGAISMCPAATKNFSGLLACRILLGLAESGFWPAVLFHMLFWYPSVRTPFRIAILFSCGEVAGLFAGLIAFAIAHLNRVGGLAGWRWLFVLEGMPVLIASLVCFLWLPDYPSTAKFLSNEERHLIRAEIPETQPSPESKTWIWAEVLSTLKDPIFYLFLLVWACHCIGAYSVTLVLPSVLYSLGIGDTLVTQLITMPPYALAMLVVLLAARLVRLEKLRPWLSALILECLVSTCYVALLFVRDAIAKYTLICFALVCATAVLPLLWAERMRTAQGTTATGLAIGLTASVVHLTGTVGPHIYQSRYGPTYQTSFAASTGLLGFTTLCMLACWLIIRKRDEKAGCEGHAR